MINGNMFLTKDEMLENLHYASAVLQTVHAEETRRLFDDHDDDDLLKIGGNGDSLVVPSEVREWLAQTFTRAQSSARLQRGKRPKFRSVAQAIRAGLLVDRMYRRNSTCIGTSIIISPSITKQLRDVESWSFNIFELSEKTSGHSLRYVAFEVLHRHGLLSKFKVPDSCLENFLAALEAGYSEHGNPYHNLTHGADVTQTTYCLLRNSGLLQWLTDLEVFATLVAALIHDYGHTGTTNNFHIMTKSRLAVLYNDKAVLENYHASASFRLMDDEDKSLTSGLTREEYREFRVLVIDIVLATDMSYHFKQLKRMKAQLQCPENIEKSRALSLMVHCADLGHPTKDWHLHKAWTDLLIEEFFKQGDREKELELPCSPLCDRTATLVEQSQIGFIDFIVEPSFEILGDMFQQIANTLYQTKRSVWQSAPPETAARNDIAPPSPPDFKRTFDFLWYPHLRNNKQKWKELAGIATAEDLEDTSEHRTRPNSTASGSVNEDSATASKSRGVRPTTANLVGKSAGKVSINRGTSTTDLGAKQLMAGTMPSSSRSAPQGAGCKSSSLGNSIGSLQQQQQVDEERSAAT